MGRPPQSEHRDTRQALMDSALELFSERGYFGTTLRDIARAVGVRESALYHYFPSKEALFEAILEQRAGSLAFYEELLSAPVDDVRELLERVGLKLIERFSTLREQRLYRILLSDGMRLAKDGRMNFHERMAAGVTLLARLMDRLVRDGWLRGAGPEFLALEFFAGFAAWRQMLAVHPQHPFVLDPRTFVRSHVDQFLLGARSGDRITEDVKET
jgi:AcrR family transcriptional regulator